jgi:hypothetical protein
MVEDPREADLSLAWRHTFQAGSCRMPSDEGAIVTIGIVTHAGPSPPEHGPSTEVGKNPAHVSFQGAR